MRPIGPPLPPTQPVPPAALFRAAMEANSGNGAAPTKDVSSDFARLMLDKLGEVNSMQVDADDKVHSMLTGGDVNEAEVLTSVQKADLAFRMILQVRNKLIEAYRELQQIQI